MSADEVTSGEPDHKATNKQNTESFSALQAGINVDYFALLVQDENGHSLCSAADSSQRFAHRSDALRHIILLHEGKRPFDCAL